jgi:hypothetical protein
MTLGRTVRAVAVCILVLTLAGCATTGARATALPIPDVGALAGTWRGTVNIGAGDSPCTLSIDPSGRAQIVGSSLTANGRVSVQNGRGTYDLPGRSEGSIELSEEGGKRQLHLRGRTGQFEVWVTKQ